MSEVRPAQQPLDYTGDPQVPTGREAFGTRGVREGSKWVVGVVATYVGLLLVFGGVLVWVWLVTANATPPAGLDSPGSQLFSLAADSFRTVLGALIGALTVAAERVWPRGN
jgi:hypothetical protein